jgi:catechol 2,3-dioxygenase-like lactoylglutathione lyase family enzyme
VIGISGTGYETPKRQRLSDWGLRGLSLKHPDIHAALETMTSRGAAFEREPHLVARLASHDLWMAFFRDPDRNLLALMSEVPK